MAKPAQDEQLRHNIEMVCEASGQQFKQTDFKQAIEQADYELVMTERGGKEGKGIQRIGRARYIFRTVFGTVRVYRLRIRHKSDNSTEIPSERQWKTVRQERITQGLKMVLVIWP